MKKKDLHKIRKVFVTSPLNAAKNTVISRNFVTWIFFGKAQFPHSFGQFAQKYTETLPLHKISMPGN